MNEYPSNLAELERRFGTQEACLDYLERLRWPDGPCCPSCGHPEVVRLRAGWGRCRRCRRRVSVLAGTIFQDTRKPLTMWFRAIWTVCSQKNGASAKSIQRSLELGSYETAWMWLHKLRRAMVRPGREALARVVEAGVVRIGGEASDTPGGEPIGAVPVGLAVEDKAREGMGRIRMGVLGNASAASLAAFVRRNVEAGAEVRFEENESGAAALKRAGFRPRPERAARLKMVRLVGSLLRRWLLGTHQGAARPEHLAYYLDEFVFRFNRRSSAHRGLLFYRLLQNAVQVSPVSYAAVVSPRAARPRRHHNR